MRFLLLLLISGTLSTASAQSISTDPIPFNSLCPDDSTYVTFKASGAFGSNNIFNVQLSDVNGSFTTFQTIGAIKSTAAGAAKVFIPLRQPTSRNYRVRVISTMPYSVGTDNGSDIYIPDVHDLILGANTGHVSIYDTVHFYLAWAHNVYPDSALAYSWDFGGLSYPLTSKLYQPPGVMYTSPGERFPTVDVQVSPRCSRQLSGHVYVYSCFPKIPNNARIIDPDTSYGPVTGQTWVRSGAVYEPMSNDTIYAEPGSVILPGGSLIVIYLKSGAESQSSAITVYEEGASSVHKVVKCPSLEFDYSEAPTPEQYAVVSQERSDFSFERIGDRIEIRSNAHIRDIQIYDLLGRLVHQQMDSNAIDLRNWTSGRYVVRVNFGREAISKMIFVE